jgi:hypothetical protein
MDGLLLRISVKMGNDYAKAWALFEETRNARLLVRGA